MGILATALFWQRIRAINDMYYFWVPWAVLLVGVWTWWRRRVALGHPDYVTKQ